MCHHSQVEAGIRLGRIALPWVTSPATLVVAVLASAGAFLLVGGLTDRQMLAALWRLRERASQAAA
jgi:hypothetical protein